jgi:uncharacterized protein (UPF0212 family)
MGYNCYATDKECDGCGGCKSKMPICPKCGEECDSFYIDGNKNILGCENCVKRVDSEND